MRHLAFLLSVSPFLVAAGPWHDQQLSAAGFSLTQPAPEGSPAGPHYDPAPLPNQNATMPRSADNSDPDGTLSPSVLSRSGAPVAGEGYSRGSSVQGLQEQKQKPGLGFSLHMPTQ